MHYDIIIVGGGLVGASLALALRETTLRIALVDAHLPSNQDPRLFALNESSCQLLKNVRVWPQVVAYASAIHQVHVSHQGHFGAVRLHCRDIHLPVLGYVIPARTLEAAFNEQMKIQPNLTLYQPAKLQNIIDEKGETRLTIVSSFGSKTLHTPIVIGADGAESTVRTQLNIATEIIDYKQSAIVTTTTLRRSHHHIAYERFSRNGTIAMLPLPENACATIWSADNEMIAELMQLNENDFLQKLQSEFSYRLGRLQKIEQRHVFPLRMIKAEKMQQGGVFLLGNAAHALHPVAAQGLNLALYEVAQLAESMMLKLSAQHVFTVADLRQVNEQIQKQRALSINVSHRLSSLFTNRSVLSSLMLQIGMLGLEMAMPIKIKLMRGLMGRTGKVPRLLLNASE